MSLEIEINLKQIGEISFIQYKTSTNITNGGEINDAMEEYEVYTVFLNTVRRL